MLVATALSLCENSGIHVFRQKLLDFISFQFVQPLVLVADTQRGLAAK